MRLRCYVKSENQFQIFWALETHSEQVLIFPQKSLCWSTVVHLSHRVQFINHSPNWKKGRIEKSAAQKRRDLNQVFVRDAHRVLLCAGQLKFIDILSDPFLDILSNPFLDILSNLFQLKHIFSVTALFGLANIYMFCLYIERGVQTRCSVNNSKNLQYVWITNKIIGVETSTIRVCKKGKCIMFFLKEKRVGCINFELFRRALAAALAILVRWCAVF